MKVETKIIIPAAGFGTRAGSPEAKELILFQDKPLISRALEIGKKLNINCHVITRVEKPSLIKYLNQFSHTHTQIITPSKEWPDTILQSEEYWAAKNILILPDTVWSPEGIEEKIIEALDQTDIAVGSFQAENYQTWGVYESTSSTYRLTEKPQNYSNTYRAWGLLAFRREVGKKLFTDILNSTFDHQEKDTNMSYTAFQLEQFRDLTR